MLFVLLLLFVTHQAIFDMLNKTHPNLFDFLIGNFILIIIYEYYLIIFDESIFLIMLKN